MVKSLLSNNKTIQQKAMDIKIAVAYHKASTLLNLPHLIPVHAGKALSSLNLGIQGDDEGENISHKNPWYCELTVLYWLWKNTTSDYKGLMHYRRSFTVKSGFWFHRFFMQVKFIIRRISSLWSPYSTVGIKKQYGTRSTDRFIKDTEAFTSRLESLLSDGTNVIAPHPGRFYMSIRRTLAWEVGGWNMDLMDEIVKEHFPEIFPYYDKAMDGLWFYNANMSVMDNDTFNDYCRFLFGVLECHEEETVKRGILKDVSSEKAFSRLSGYLAEMLTNAYIQYCISTGKKVKVLPVTFLK